MYKIRKTSTRFTCTMLMAIFLLCAAPLVIAQEKGGSEGGGDDGRASTNDGGVPEVIGNAFTYQGVIKQSGTPISGSCDLQFSLWNAVSGPAQIGSTNTFFAQGVTAGLITNDLNFGAGAFDGNDRWIEVSLRFPAGGGSYTTLTPRQKLSAVPYALFSVGGNTGFTLPYSASASSASDLMTLTNTFGGDAGYSGRIGGPNYGLIGKHNVTNNLGFVGHAGYGVLAIGEGATSIGVRGTHAPSGHDGELGDPNAGVQGLHIPSGNFGRIGTADYGVFGQVQATTGQAVYGENLSTGTNGRLGDGVAGVDGLATINNGRPGMRGIHTPTGNYGRLGSDTFGADGVHQASGNFGFLGTAVAGAEGHHASSGNYGRLGTDEAGVQGFTSAGIFGPSGALGLDAQGSPSIGVFGQGSGGDYAGYFTGGTVFVEDISLPLEIRRSSNGILVSFDNLTTSGIGSISLSGGTVMYNPFTGAHFGWTDQVIERGTLVALTGRNRHSHDVPNAEVIYGIAPSAAANDPRCVGAYVSVQTPSTPADNDNPHLIMAVGNGDMWVAQSSTSDIQPGDYLISSDVTGCAMKDDPQRFPVGYIVARAGEAVDWSAIDSPTDGSAKRKKISVFFENFVRDSRGAELAAIVREQTRRIESLEAEVRSLQSIAERLARLEQEARFAANHAGIENRDKP